MLAIWVRLTFTVFKFGECHVWRSIFVCKYYIFGEFYFGESNSQVKIGLDPQKIATFCFYAISSSTRSTE